MLRNICGDWPRNQLYRVKRILRPRKHGAGVDFTTDNLQSTIKMYHIYVVHHMSQTTVYTSHKIFNIYKYLDWQGRDIYLFVWWHPGEARGLWFPWWGQQPSFCHRFDRAELVCWSIGTTWQIKQCFIVVWMKHIPHHDIDAAREWSDQCLQPPWALSLLWSNYQEYIKYQNPHMWGENVRKGNYQCS